MKSTFPGLFIGCWFFIFGIAFVQGEEALVAKGSGNISIFQDASTGPVQKMLAENVGRFVITRGGHFIMEDYKTHAWYKGRVDSSLNVEKHLLISAHGINTQIAISEDGKRVAWANYGPNKSDLIIEEYSENQPTVICRLTTDGLILAPSWSPDGRLLAFFIGPPGSEVRDGFALMLLDVDDENSKSVSLAPSSLPLPGRINPSRTKPLWAPNGKYILFEGRYHESDNIKSLYIISVDGRKLIACNYRGDWDQEGKYLYVIKAKGKKPTFPEENIALKVDVFQNKEYLIQDLKIPGGYLDSIRVSPSANKVAYIQNKALAGVTPSAQNPIASKGLAEKDNELFIYNSKTNNSISFGIGFSGAIFSSYSYTPVWIIPAEAGNDEAVKRSPANITQAAVTVKIPFPGKESKNRRLFDIVTKIRTKEVERNHINVSVEDAKKIARFFHIENGYDENYSLPPDDYIWKLYKSLEDVRINNKDKDEAYKSYFGENELSKTAWENNLDKYKTAEDVRQFRKKIAINLDELIDLRYPNIQKRVESWLLFRKVARAGPGEESYDDKLLEQERKWWKSRLDSYRKLIDVDITDQDILIVITNKLDLSPAKEEFLRNYFEKKTR